MRTPARRLVGRERELALMDEAIMAAAGGTTQVALLTGPAGIGKSSLAQKVADDAEARGFVTAWGACWESVDTPPFWPWIQLLRTLLQSGLDMDVAPWVMDEVDRVVNERPATAGAEPEPPDQRLALFHAVVAFVRQVLTQRPLALFLEDLHAADESSLLLLEMIARDNVRSRLLMVATVDPHAIRPRRRHAELLNELTLRARRIDLSPLGDGDVAELVAQSSMERPSPPILAAITQVSEGNPFFIDEALRLLTSKGSLYRPDHSVGFRVPEGARGLVSARLGALPQESQELLGVASVIGREFDLGLLGDITELPHETLLDLLEVPLQTAVIEDVGVDRYRFTHILLRETAYEDLRAAKRMRLHRRIAEVLEQEHAHDLEQHYTVLAHHWFKAAQGGDVHKTIHFAEAAARQATARQAHEEAARLYQRALKASESTRSPKETRQRLMEGLEQAQRFATATNGATGGASAEAEFRLEGDYWVVGFAGESTRLKDSKGLQYLARLLENPGRELHSLALAGGEASPARGGEAVRSEGLSSSGFDDLGPLLDQKAKDQYRRRIEELRSEIDELERFNDHARAARAQEELGALIAQLTGAVGLGGRDRTTGPSERARISVTKNLKEALKRTEEALPKLGAHLRATVKTGTFCSYTPDPRAPIEWAVR